MSQPTTPGPVEQIRGLVEPTNHRDFHAMVSLYAPKAVHDTSPWGIHDTSPWGMGTYEGPSAIRRLFEDWIGAYSEFEIELEEVLDLGSGIILVVFCQSSRAFGRRDYVRLQMAWVYEWAEGMVVRVTAYPGIGEARAAAERLAEERGQTMTEEFTTPGLVELTRQGIDATNRRDLDALMSLYAPDAVWESLDGLGVFEGATAIRGFVEDWLNSYEAHDTEPEEVLEIGSGITFVVGRQSGRLLGAAGRVEQRVAHAMAWERGLVVHTVAGMDIDRVRAAAERLAEERG